MVNLNEIKIGDKVVIYTEEEALRNNEFEWHDINKREPQFWGIDRTKVRKRFGTIETVRKISSFIYTEESTYSLHPSHIKAVIRGKPRAFKIGDKVKVTVDKNDGWRKEHKEYTGIIKSLHEDGSINYIDGKFFTDRTKRTAVLVEQEEEKDSMPEKLNFKRNDVLLCTISHDIFKVGNHYLVDHIDRSENGIEKLMLIDSDSSTGIVVRGDDRFFIKEFGKLLNTNEPLLSYKKYICIEKGAYSHTRGRIYSASPDKMKIYDDSGLPLYPVDGIGIFMGLNLEEPSAPGWDSAGTDIPRSDIPPKEQEVPRWDLPEDGSKVEPEKESLPELRDLEVKEEIRKMIDKHPIMLIGEVGAAKTTIAMDMSKELELEFGAIVMTRQTTQSHLLGFISVDGKYIPSTLRKAYEFGGLYLIDEIDASDPNTIICLNTIENGFLAFPDRIVYAHKDFRLISTANEESALHVHVGKNKQDKSVKNRWHRIQVIPDLASRFKESSIKIFRAVNDALVNRGVTELATPRDLKRFEDLLKEDMDILTAIQKTLMFDVSMSRDEVYNIYKEAEYWDLPL